jgi:6-methylsalicylate decarboxylase
MGCPLTPEEIIADFKTFYFDTALSTYDHTMAAMKSFVGAERIVYGSDFPGKPRICFIRTQELPLTSLVQLSPDK